MNKDTKWAVVTGASSGIGAEISRSLAKRGINLVLAARTETKLSQLGKLLEKDYGIQCQVQVVDLALPSAPEELFQAVKDLPVSILINNAGFGFIGPYTTADWSWYQQMLQVNVSALAHLTWLFIPGFREQGQQTYILNVGSVAGWQGVPNFAFYAATKAFVNAFSEGLAWELEKTNISVTCLQPGKTTSGFFNASGVGEDHENFTQQGVMQAENVAEEGVEAMFAKENYLVTGVMNKMNVLSSRLVPRWVLKKTMKFLFKEFDE